MKNYHCFRTEQYYRIGRHIKTTTNSNSNDDPKSAKDRFDKMDGTLQEKLFFENKTALEKFNRTKGTFKSIRKQGS